MTIARNSKHQQDEPKDDSSSPRAPWKTTNNPKQLRDLGFACMLNTEVGAVLAVLRRNQDPNSHMLPSSDDGYASPLIHSLKSLRALIFSPQQEWKTIDPTTYISPFLDIIQGDEVPAAATGVALSALLKILKIEIFDEKTPGARDGINCLVSGLILCRLEKTNPALEDAVMMRILQVLVAVMKNPASVLLTDQAVCTVVSTCFNIVQQSASRGDLLQRNARHTMHELIQVIFARLPQVEASQGDGSDFDIDDGDTVSGYGVRSMVYLFQFLCSLLNVVEVVYGEGVTLSTDEDIQLFALILINSAIELGGQEIGKHPKLMRMIEDDFFHHLIHYGMCSSPLVLSMICSTVLNLYVFLRRHLRLQLEAFFTFVLFKVAANFNAPQLQDVAIEGIINFCKQPNFTIEAFVNYDCDPICRNIFEDIMKLLCKTAFPMSSPLSYMQVQAFEGLVAVVYNLADNMNMEKQMDFGVPRIELTEYRPFWVEKCNNFEDVDTWVEFMRTRKLQKRKIMIAANHFNRDEKKATDFLKISHILPDPPDAKTLAHFYRYAPGLDKNKIGDFVGDPDEFNIQVLKEYSETFDFSGVILDTALRTYLETFRLPGEAQKIQRILEVFSERFYEQQSSEIFVCKDAVFILCYSLIMLNTDQHNPQVKKKMTEEEFIKNNRAINEGKDLPRDYLSELFQSISNNAITIFGQSGAVVDMNPKRWTDLIKRSNHIEPFMLCNFEPRICREMFAVISGPTIASLSAVFEHADEDEILQECVEGLISVARITRHGLGDILDELLACLSKFTTLQNPYATAEETVFTFGNDLKPRMATLSMFSIANQFGDAIRGGWRNIIDCLLKLKRLKLMPQSVLDPDSASATCNDLTHSHSESGIIFPSLDSAFTSSHQISTIMSRFSQFLSLDSMEDSLAGNDFEHNLKIIEQCRIRNIFTESYNFPGECLQTLVRALIFAATCKSQKISTVTEEEETVEFCWELIYIIGSTNIHRLPTFWPSLNEHLTVVAQFPIFPSPFPGKAMDALLKICSKLFCSSSCDKVSEELILKSINLVGKMDKDVLDNCLQTITETITKTLREYPQNIQTPLGWKILILFLTKTACVQETTFDQGVEALISLLSNENNLNKMNYANIIGCAIGFAAHKICPSEVSIKILDLMAESVNVLIHWYRTGYSDPGSNASNMSSSSTEDWSKANTIHYPLTMFLNVADAFRRICLASREEITRNHSISALQRIFVMGEELGFTDTSCMSCFNSVLFAMVDDLQEKMAECSERSKSEKEMLIVTFGMEGTLILAIKLMTEVFIQFLRPLTEAPGFRQFWQVKLLRRMNSYMTVDLGYETRLRESVPGLLKKMITVMKEKNVLVQREGDDLWETTCMQIQWIAPSIKEELFPED
ncbi:ARF guanine-nucleotide exchange factor GNL2-like [Aristolochia californica]|uniref:ARF guanine-nucleotide exchange factor GNL2-like n=1 Tax=Aristolochia californica TaxID=171875 RepID=UPI0035E3639D